MPKKRKQKIESREAVKESVVEVKRETRLTETQLRVVDQNSFQVEKIQMQIESAKKDQHIFQLQLQKTDLQSTILRFNMADKQRHIEDLEEGLKGTKIQGKDFLKSLADELGLEGQWGFDPDTGEIIT